MIPPLAHFVWLGPEFPWLNALAVASALERGGFTRVILHHDQDLRGRWAFDSLTRRAGFEARRLEVPALCDRAGVPAGTFSALLERLRAPAARANVLRALVLHGEGGVYLDLDTVTLRSLAPLREQAGCFAGQERLAFPARVVRGGGPLLRARAYALAALRTAFRLAPGGYRGFRAIERWYWPAVNNAVLGARPGHPLTARLLAAMERMPADASLRRYALGTHLLQQTVAELAGTAEAGDLRIVPPDCFYPLAPEIADHWFRPARAPRLDAALRPETVIVHWYASHRTRRWMSTIDPAYVRAHADRQLFSALALPFCAPGAWPEPTAPA